MVDEASSYQEAAITWEVSIPLLTNPLILRQMALVVFGAGLFMALLMSLILAARGEFEAIPPMLLISALTTAGLGLLMGLVTVVFFGGRVRVRFTVDEDGALWETIDRRAKAGSRLAMVAGLLAGSPQTAGAGALAAAREVTFVRWRDLAAVRTNERHRMITLRDSWHPLMMLVCLPENYDRVAAYVRRRL
jgi:hypothetical protein